MSTPHWSTKLVKLNACREAVDYAKQHKTLQSAWNACERGDWLLWLLGKLSGSPESQSRRDLVLMACACARLSLKHVRKGEKRPLQAIKTAERWAKREAGVSLEDVRYAAAAAYAAATADAYAATAAAYAAADAAYASFDAAYASFAAAYASFAAARTPTLSQCADIVRKMHPKAPRLK